jgi:hypothetical protein
LGVGFLAEDNQFFGAGGNTQPASLATLAVDMDLTHISINLMDFQKIRGMKLANQGKICLVPFHQSNMKEIFWARGIVGREKGRKMHRDACFFSEKIH